MTDYNKNGNADKIGFWSATSLVLGNMIGSGIFLLPAALAVYGGITIFGWIFTTIGVVFLALIFARLSRIITDPGGPYVYSREGFGSFAGFLVAWGYWVSIWCGNAAIAVAGAGYLRAMIPGLNDNKVTSGIIAVAAIWFFTLINTRRIKSVAKVQVIITVIKIIPLLVIGTIGFLYFDIDNFRPFNNSGLSSMEAITATAALTLWAFLGLESATIPSDKIKNPRVNIPRATITGILFAALVYIASTVAIMGIIEPEKLQHSVAPFADAAKSIWGSGVSYFFAASAAIACFGTLNGWILFQGQIPMIAANDNIFPLIFKKTSKRGVPLFGVIFSSLLATILVGLNYSRGLVGMFSFIIMLSTFTVLLPYVLTSLSEIMLYLRHKKEYSKKRLMRSLMIGIPAFLYSLWAVVGLGIEIILWGTALLIAGIPIYLRMIVKSKKSRNTSTE